MNLVNFRVDSAPELSIRKLKKQLYYTVLFTLISSLGYAGSPTTGQGIMNSKKTCDLTPVQRSQEMIRTILDDISRTYTLPGGGGISKIGLIATNVYVVSIPQEERIDEITYEMSINSDCKAVILKSRNTTVSMP